MVIYISKSNINNILRVKSKTASNLMSIALHSLLFGDLHE